MSELSLYFVLLLSTVQAQASSGGIKAGTLVKNYNPPFPITIDGKSLGTALTIDANWRWVHTSDGSKNCYTGSSWDPTLCPDGATCAKNCLLEGVSQDQWKSTYGVNVDGKSLTLHFDVTGSNIGSRLYLLDPTMEKYQGFNLLNKEFTFTVDVSKLGCGMNGALYFVDMDLAGNNPGGAGPAYGTGYADAQMPGDIKFVNGIPNLNTKHPLRPGAAEMDIWEANKWDTALTPHPALKDGVFICQDDIECGLGPYRYQALTDMDGADLNAYRLGLRDLYGPGKKVDTNKPMPVITQFITDDGTESGTLVEIKRFYEQGGKRIDGGHISDVVTEERKRAFNETNYFATVGGLAGMGRAFKKDMVLVLSIWGDTVFNMAWLDSVMPSDLDKTTLNGTVRGPCTPTSTYQDTLRTNQGASVVFGDISVTTLNGGGSKGNPDEPKKQ